MNSGTLFLRSRRPKSSMRSSIRETRRATPIVLLSLLAACARPAPTRTYNADLPAAGEVDPEAHIPITQTSPIEVSSPRNAQSTSSSGRASSGEIARESALGTSGSGTIFAYESASGRASVSAGALGWRGAEIPPARAGDQFEHYGFNEWTETTRDNLATFSVDVDTASYSIARRILETGALPSPESIRVEEFINTFEYGYAAPAGNAPFSVHVDAAPSEFGEGKHLMRVGIQGAELDSAERVPANLVFLIDTSGSMQSADKLPLVKYALKALLDGLGPDDTLSIVTYAGSAEILIPPTRVVDRLAIVRAINSLSAGGGTNGADGIRTAYELAYNSRIRGGINRVVWCSDGDLNVGMTGDELLEFVEERGQQGVNLTTLGFGTGNLNDRDLERFADKGDGNYHYISSTNEALRVLSTDFDGTLSVIARDVKIQVQLNSEFVADYRLIGYENRNIADADFRDDSVDAGEIGSGHSVTALLEFTLRESRQPRDSAEIATVTVRYELPEEDGHGREIDTSLRFSEISETFDQASTDFQLAAAVGEFAEQLRMAEFASGGTLEDVREVLVGVARSEDSQVAELLGLVASARALAQN